MRNVVMFWMYWIVEVAAVAAARLLCFGFVGGRPSPILKLTTSSLYLIYCNLLCCSLYCFTFAAVNNDNQ